MDCGLALWCAAGTGFQADLMTAQGAAADELLQAVMQRLEDDAAPQAIDAAAAPEPGQCAPVQQPLQGAA